jgi:hypothetical protein
MLMRDCQSEESVFAVSRICSISGRRTCSLALYFAFAASKDAGYMSLQRPWDAGIVTVGQKRTMRITK